MKNVIRTVVEVIRTVVERAALREQRNSAPKTPVEIRRENYGKRASVLLDDNHYYFITKSGGGLRLFDPEASPIILPKSSYHEDLTKTLFEILEKSRFMDGIEMNNLIKSRVIQNAELQWEIQTAKQQGYKNRTTFYKSVKQVWVHLVRGELLVFPTRGMDLHKATGQGEDQTISIPGDSPPEEIWAAIRLGFERWQP